LLKENNFTADQLNKTSYIAHKKNNAARIALEYKRLMNLEVPLVNVAANPSEHNLYFWQGILQGPIDTIYEGMILKFEIRLPDSYPLAPPVVKVYGDLRITHPNIFDNGVICLDFLELSRVYKNSKNPKDKEFQSWKSSSSIYSILHQLQGFFYEGNDLFSKLHRIKKRRLIREQILKIKEDLIEYDKNKRELIRLEIEEKNKALQNIMKEEAGLKYLLARKAKEEAKNEKRREKQRAKRRERRALEREKRKKENEERIRKIKE
jgi:ubiquitin-conjugating enzyme E2 G2